MHAMRKLIILLSALVYVIHAQAQFSVTAHQEGWDNIPPQVQKPGFSFQQSVFANMDGDDALEEVMLFGRDNGHYPTFDLFKAYYAIVDNYTKEVQYISDEIYVTDKYNLLVEAVSYTHLRRDLCHRQVQSPCRRPQQGRHLRALHILLQRRKVQRRRTRLQSAHHTLLRPYRMEPYWQKL